jgi:N-methylhydantoinase B/oxoprolinase/acetone carboxylase alpha subunit
MTLLILEIRKNAFTAIPEEMGAALKRTAYSPSIKERLDASYAIFEVGGRIRRRVGSRMSVSANSSLYTPPLIYCQQ